MVRRLRLLLRKLVPRMVRLLQPTAERRRLQPSGLRRDPEGVPVLLVRASDQFHHVILPVERP
ncbi:UNVERIFIED_CONTAM: hypothetical protein PYX00_008111 [Menopon gallinae]|uniref:Uncharacterized protein n=1 Tax=Menopon gallinae TaxID=328185 RepID=A0AAW2HME6_9NEOP